MRLRIIDTDSPHIVKMFEAGQKRANNLKLPLTEIGFDILFIEKAVFASEGRRGGGSWKALKPATVRKKGSTQILYTGAARAGYSKQGNDALYKSVSQLKAPYQIFEVTGKTLDFGTSAPHADKQQYGAPGKRVPARPFLKFTPADQNRWMNILLEHLTAPFREHSHA